MTDAELIHALRTNALWVTTHDAADRIKGLTAQVAENRISEPHDPGDFVGDIYFGHPVKTTMGTHRWTGSEWVKLPSETEALMGLLADARSERDALRAKAVEALTNIDALDPENLVVGCSQDALSGLVNRMGDIARATLAELKGESHE